MVLGQSITYHCFGLLSALPTGSRPQIPSGNPVVCKFADPEMFTIMNTEFSTKSVQRTILTIYADADDEVLPAAGTLRLMSLPGWNVRCLNLTDSNLSSSAVKGKQHQEAEAVGKVIGATYVHTLEESNFLTQAVQAKTFMQLNAIIVRERVTFLGEKSGQS